MRNFLLPLFLFSAINLSAQMGYKPNQRLFEAGFLFGMTNYSGDLTDKSIQLSETKLGYGLFARYMSSAHFAIRGHFLSGSISGDDANSKSQEFKRRSFRFDANFYELGLCAEWHVLGRGKVSATGDSPRFIAPYLYLGIGGGISDPVTSYYGSPNDQDLFFLAPFPEITAAQPFLLLPMGLGVQTGLNDRLLLGLEFGWRPTFSDKLDGVRLNGNPDNNDWYYFGGLSLSYILSKPQKSI